MWMINPFEKIDEIEEHLGYVRPITVKEICMNLTSGGEGLSLQEIIHQAAPDVFCFNFPIHDENHRLALEEKVLKRYFYRRICCEDVDEWTLRLDAKLNEIMPYYNKMYESLDYLVNIMDDVDYLREVGEDSMKSSIENTKSTQNSESSGSNTGSKSETTEGSREHTENRASTEESSETTTGTKAETSQAVTKYSDTPQGDLTGVTTGRYLTNATIVDATGNEDTEGTAERKGKKNDTGADRDVSNVENTVSTENSNENSSSTVGTFDTNGSESGNRKMKEHVKGKMYAGSKAKYVMEYRKAIMNVDAEILGRLADLFLNVY